ncbi:MAG: hypothetical protein H0W72_01355 [Planctomycetes bacterium]|nr:hypothetical protein [Planctomycetota bacterium]
MAVLAALALVFSLHAGSCGDHGHDDDDHDGGEPTHLVCHCTCHDVTVPDAPIADVPMITGRQFVTTYVQPAVASVVLEVDPPTDKRSA